MEKIAGYLGNSRIKIALRIFGNKLFMIMENKTEI